MHHHPLSMLTVLTTVPIYYLATPLIPRWDDLAVKHRWNTVPSNWERLSQPPADTTIDLYIALKPHRENALIDALREVSDPRHPRYGTHLSKEQVAEHVAPHPDTLELVYSWLGHHGVPISSVSTSHGGNWLTLAGVPVSQANDLLGASYQLYWHSETNDTVVRTLSYALPVALHTHVQTVAPTTFFGSPRTSWQTPRMHPGGAAAAQAKAALGEPVEVLSRRDYRVTPSFLRWLYKTTAYVPVATDRNALGVAGFIGQFPGPWDLRLFTNKYRTDAVDASFTVVRINGGEYDPNNPGDEANVDIQYTQGMAYPTPHIFYSTGGQEQGLDSTNDPYLNWLGYMLAQKSIPQTVSTSYSGPESDFPVDYAMSVCNLFGQLGVRGVSVLFSTGDFGVGSGTCNDGSGKVRFIPHFPASCPWLTSVGGTTSYRPEVAASFSGGGFSNHFPRPDYQDGAVATFFRHLGREYAGLYNPGGRGIPDISAQALKYLVVLKGETRVASGTSCSTPAMAGVIALLNDFLLRNGRRPLGFLNPWLYSSGLAGLNDITFGSNPGCKTNGFSAVPGWDPVTGLGTPDFLKLREILGRLPSNLSRRQTQETNCSLAEG